MQLLLQLPEYPQRQQRVMDLTDQLKGILPSWSRAGASGGTADAEEHEHGCIPVMMAELNVFYWFAHHRLLTMSRSLYRDAPLCAAVGLGGEAGLGEEEGR
jgi:hypothetical protein